LIERILFLEGTPNLNDLPKLNIGKDVKQQLQNDLALEENAVAEYNDAVAAAQKAGDNGSAELLKKLLMDEEGHVDFLETQLGIIKDIGLENYLSEQAEASRRTAASVSIGARRTGRARGEESGTEGSDRRAAISSFRRGEPS
jgi:bacterioferritin